MKLECIYREQDYTVIWYDEYFVKSNLVPLRIVNELCIDNLSTYEGRKQAVRKKFGYKTLTPIYVSDEVLLFPIMSTKDYENVWINYHAVHHHEHDRIILNSGKMILCEPHIIERQLKNCFEIAFY